jgi:hypothetical protein
MLLGKVICPRNVSTLGVMRMPDTMQREIPIASIMRIGGWEMGGKTLKDEMDRLKADTLREDGRLERHCKCGVGHTVGHLRGYLNDNWETVHGCCGCCRDYERQEIKGEKA